VAGADISWPFYKRLRAATVVLEPVVQVALSPNVDPIVVGRTATGEAIYLDEDAQTFEFDESNLFRANKFPGFDLYEDGLRLNVGARASVLWDDGRRANLLIGRSFRDERNEVFAARTGLRSRASDWIVAAEAQPIKGLSVFTRARLDGDDLGVRRAESGANVATKWGGGYVRYLRDDADINGLKRENFDAGGEVFVTKHWGVTAYGNRDLIQNAWVVRDLGVVYRDECARFEVIYRREDTIIGRLGRTESITFRITLATLGGPVYAE
jgi:LPS-assembly protein